MIVNFVDIKEARINYNSMMKNNLDQRRAQALGRIATRMSLRFQRDLAERLSLDEDVSPAQKTLLINIEDAGTRVTTLAKRLNVSKQAASKLVLELEARDLVVRTPDPADSRAIVVSYTDTGRSIVEDTVGYFDEIEAQIAAHFGRGKLAKLRKEMKALADFLDPDGF